MKKRDLEKFFEACQERKCANLRLTENEIIEQVFKESVHHPMYRNAFASYVKQKWNEERREKERERERDLSGSKEVQEEPLFTEAQWRRIKRGARESDLKYNKIPEMIIKGEISTDQLKRLPREIRNR